jgi:uncharacterized protein YcaQ
MSLSLSLPEARRLVITAQGFRTSGAAAKPAGVKALTERLGVLQIDSVNALVRSHYLPLFSRLGNYPMDWLDQQAWGSGQQRNLFEYWGHEASLLPMSLHPLLRWRMRRAAAGQGIYRQLAEFGHQQQPLIRQVLQTVREHGALGAGSLGKRAQKAGPWWDWSAEKQALEWLFAAGEVTVASRRGFERLYDLPDRVLPGAILNQPEPDELAAQRQLLLHAARAMGLATEQDLRDYFRMDTTDTRLRLGELAETGELQQVQVEGWRHTAWCPGELKVPRGLKPTALLSPFDSLIWARERTERLFGFRYRLELYTPAAKRVYGYYVLPFLYAGQLVGRVDLRAERAHGRLAVHAVHEEALGMSTEALVALGRQLRTLADWLGLERIQLNCRRPEAERLRAGAAGLMECAGI